MDARDKSLLKIYKQIAQRKTAADRAPFLIKLALLDKPLFEWTLKTKPWSQRGM